MFGLVKAAALCSNAVLDPVGAGSGDATEIAIMLAADQLGADVSTERRSTHRRRQFNFDTTLRMMSTVDETSDGLVLHVKGAPEEVVARCVGMNPDDASRMRDAVDSFAGRGLRVLAVARRVSATPSPRSEWMLNPSSS